jgi:hypothetical protein
MNIKEHEKFPHLFWRSEKMRGVKLEWAAYIGRVLNVSKEILELQLKTKDLAPPWELYMRDN